MGWYHSAYSLKEQNDLREKAHQDHQKHPRNDLSKKGKWFMVGELLGCTQEPMFHNRGTTTNSWKIEQKTTTAESFPGAVLEWLDDGFAVDSMSEHLIKTLKPADAEAANKILTTMLTQITQHMRKQGRVIRQLEDKTETLAYKLATYEANPTVIKHLTLQELKAVESKMHDASRKLKSEIEAFYARSLTFPNEFLCPLTHEVFQDPVITKDGHTYERKAISLWLQNHDTSPMTNIRLVDKSLTPNISLRNSISAFREKHKSVNSDGINGGNDPS
mmetsp:Transcript_2681/g.4941  ORF Transcript_2681/g.4941 Transcript_2681/m.4941 type:complete len:275 (+) Transcript_2681:1467-2291(+)